MGAIMALNEGHKVPHRLLNVHALFDPAGSIWVIGPMSEVLWGFYLCHL